MTSFVHLAEISKTVEIMETETTTRTIAFQGTGDGDHNGG